MILPTWQICTRQTDKRGTRTIGRHQCGALSKNKRGGKSIKKRAGDRSRITRLGQELGLRYEMELGRLNYLGIAGVQLCGRVCGNLSYGFG